MDPCEIGQVNYTLLWLYAGCFVLIWVYLPLVERVEEEPAWLYWSSVAMHVAGFTAMVVYLTETTIAGAYVWWPLFVVFIGLVLIEDVMCYRWMRSKPEPRASTNQHRVACFFGAAVHTVVRLPCAVIIRWLAERG